MSNNEIATKNNAIRNIFKQKEDLLLSLLGNEKKVEKFRKNINNYRLTKF